MMAKTKMSDDGIIKRLHSLVEQLRSSLEWCRDETTGRLGMYSTIKATYESTEGERVVLVVGIEEPEDETDEEDEGEEDEG